VFSPQPRDSARVSRNPDLRNLIGTPAGRASFSLSTGLRWEHALDPSPPFPPRCHVRARVLSGPRFPSVLWPKSCPAGLSDLSSCLFPVLRHRTGSSSLPLGACGFDRKPCPFLQNIFWLVFLLAGAYLGQLSVADDPVQGRGFVR